MLLGFSFCPQCSVGSVITFFFLLSCVLVGIYFQSLHWDLIGPGNPDPSIMGKFLNYFTDAFLLSSSVLSANYVILSTRLISSHVHNLPCYNSLSYCPSISLTGPSQSHMLAPPPLLSL